MARKPDLPLIATVFALSLGAGMAARAYVQAPPKGPPDSAPGRTARRSRFGDYVVAGRTVTIAAPRERIYGMWRDPRRLTEFMQGLSAVETGDDDHMVWLLDTPDGPLRVKARVVDERENEAVAWRSVEGSDVEIEAKVQLRDAPAGRGTEVAAHVAWRPHAGIAGRWAALLRGTDPAVRGRQDLKRLKMLLETGEIATAANTRTA